MKTVVFSLVKDHVLPSIYDEREEARIERELDEALSDREADELLERLEAKYLRFRQDVFAKWPVAKQAAFDRQALLYSCLQVRDSIDKFSDEDLEVEEGVDAMVIVNFYRKKLKSLQSSLVHLRVWRAVSLASEIVQLAQSH